MENQKILADPQKIKKQALLRDISHEAKEYFADKSLAEEFYGLRLFCMYALLPFSLLSMANAIGMFISPTQSTQAFVVMLLAAILLVALIEGAKTFFFIKAMKQYYVKGFTGFFILFFALFAGGLTLSVYTSIQGAQDMIKNFDTAQAKQESNNDSLKSHHIATAQDQSTRAEKAHSAHIASLKADYTRRIQAEQQGLQEYKNSVTWEGKINIHNPSNAYNINAYQQRITDLQAQLAKEIDIANKQYASRLQKMQENEKEVLIGLDKKHKDATTKNAKNQHFSVWFWAIVSGANEVLIIFCAWFLIHYRWLCKTEPEMLIRLSQEQNAFERLANYAFMFSHHDLQVLAGNTPQHLQVLNKAQQDNSQVLPKKTPPGFKTYDEFPPTLEEALLSGIIDTAVLAEHYRKNVNQVNEVRKDLNIEVKSKPKKEATQKEKVVTKPKTLLLNFLGEEI